MSIDFILFKQYNLSLSKMYQNLLALHAVKSGRYLRGGYRWSWRITFFSPSSSKSKIKEKNPSPAVEPNEAPANLKWTLPEDDFLVTLEDDGWRICFVVSFDDARNTIEVYELLSISTRAKGDTGKTYWIYSPEENIETHDEKNVLLVPWTRKSKGEIQFLRFWTEKSLKP